MKLYGELAGWFHLLTAPASYAKEARIYGDLMLSKAAGPVRRVLELGSGGGNNASHLKARFELTLTDASAPMLEVSRALNPECAHLRADMRTLCLDQTFDAVFVHDAVMYMASEADLRATMVTAAEHCRPGGVVLFAPDCVAETFREYDDEGGHDGDDGRSLRYRERISDPDPSDSSYRVDFSIRLRERDGTERTETESHVFGLFRKAEWLDWLSRAGLVAEAFPVDLGGEGRPSSYVFLGLKPGER
jgi:SAM-dependent methyltransferase